MVAFLAPSVRGHCPKIIARRWHCADTPAPCEEWQDQKCEDMTQLANQNRLGLLTCPPKHITLQRGTG